MSSSPPYASPPGAPRRARVGFIGLGIMGRPMAGHILSAGFPLIVTTRTRASAAGLIEAGASWADTAADVAAGSDIVLTMLPDTPDVETVLTGAGGVVDGAPHGVHVVDMSTISPVATRELAARLAERGIALVDAPVSGGERAAIDATLSIMVGGPSRAIAVVRPVLEVLGRTIVRVGETGAGQVAKACNQLIVAANIQAVAEALALATKAGVDPAMVREALMGGFASSRVLDVHGQRMLDRTFQPGFRVRLHRKDAAIIRSLADSVHASVPSFEVAARALDALCAAGSGDLDHSALYLLLDREAVN